MNLEKELEILIDKHKGKQVGLGEIRLDWFAEDCLKEIRRLKDVIAHIQKKPEPCDYCKSGIDTASLMGSDMVMRFVHPVKFCPNCNRELGGVEN